MSIEAVRAVVLAIEIKNILAASPRVESIETWGGSPSVLAVDLGDGRTAIVRVEDGSWLSQPPTLEDAKSEPLLDPDCRDDKHGSCVGDPCECECHQPGGVQ